MFTTVEEVKELTGYDVSEETLRISQYIIESFVGRVEAEVSNAQDLMLLARATAYQAAYGEGTQAKAVFEQPHVKQMTTHGDMITFTDDGSSPYIARLAVFACRGLSWKRMRSVKTGSIFATPVAPVGWRED